MRRNYPNWFGDHSNSSQPFRVKSVLSFIFVHHFFISADQRDRVAEDMTHLFPHHFLFFLMGLQPAMPMW